jgi:hypothetical protein
MSIHSKRYVSKALHYTFHVRPAIVDYISDEYNRVREREVDPALICEFDNLVTRSSHSDTARYDRAFATRAFFPNAAWRDHGLAPAHQILGAIPLTTPQPMYEPGPDGTGRIAGMTEPYDPTLHFGVFYLDWIPDLKRRSEAEKALDESGFNGVEFVEVIAEALAKPWPAYDQIAPQGADKKIAAAVRDLGIDVWMVVEYEQANKNRDAVLNALRELASEQAEAAADEAALERTL